MTETCRFGRIEVRLAERQLLVGGEPAKLGARAFDLLLALVERRERVVSKNELLDLVWPGLVVEENNLQVHISTLRKLLGPAVIATIPGRGYRFTQTPDGATSGGAAAEPPTAAAPGAPVEALPQLLGREDDLGALRAVVLAHRVVTGAGASGIGKTTLARALAHRIRDAFGDGACLVELAPVSDPSLVATAVATALQVKLGNQSPFDAIAQVLGVRRMLVLLDNCEHLLHAVAELVEVLRPAALGVHWLATSQEPLKLAGEQVFRLGALALPAEETVEAAQRAGAVALFEARARAADPRFALTEDNVAAAIDICRHLDGIALAIELAAARVPLLGLAGLRRRLGERLHVLTSGPRLALPRHQTLRAALEWSHSLLTLGEPRYRLLETMRQYALDRLEAAGDGDATRTRHLDVFVALAEQAKAELFGPQQGPWMTRLDLDRENLLAAHAWCHHVANGGERDLRLVIGLYRYWNNRAFLSPGYRVTSEALNRRGAESRDQLRCKALIVAGMLAARAGLYAEAMQAHREAIAIGRELGATESLAEALTSFGVSCLEQGDLVGARASLKEALALAQKSGAASFELRFAANALGELERLEGHWAAARSLYEVALAAARQQGDPISISTNLSNLAITAMAQGHVTGTRELLIESFKVLDERSTDHMPMRELLWCAGLAALLGRWQQSARFEGAARLHLARLGWSLEAADKAFVDSFSARTRDALGDAAFDAAQASGRNLSFDEALNELRQWLQDAP